jgi:hypothetical protein
LVVSLDLHVFESFATHCDAIIYITFYFSLIFVPMIYFKGSIKLIELWKEERWKLSLTARSTCIGYLSNFVWLFSQVSIIIGWANTSPTGLTLNGCQVGIHNIFHPQLIKVQWLVVITRSFKPTWEVQGMNERHLKLCSLWMWIIWSYDKGTIDNFRWGYLIPLAHVS